MTNDLKRCPFCTGNKGTAIGTPLIVSNGVDTHYVECDHCGLSGPTSETPDGACISWNFLPRTGDGIGAAVEVVRELKFEGLLAGTFQPHHGEVVFANEAISRLRALPTPQPAEAALVEALREAAWQIDSNEVTFDSTVLFGPGYNFEGLENGRLEYAGRLGWAVIWPEDWPHNKRWRYYCEPDGVMPTRLLPDKRSAMLEAEAIVDGRAARAKHRKAQP